MPPPPSNSAPCLAMTRSKADPDFPSLISDLTSLLLHSPVASPGAAAPIFSSSSLSIPTPPKPAAANPMTATEDAAAAAGPYPSMADGHRETSPSPYIIGEHHARCPLEELSIGARWRGEAGQGRWLTRPSPTAAMRSKPTTRVEVATA
ncbi:unnamed protein product [Urochloa humidicola]